MSFDLFFCWRESKRIDIESVAKWADRIEHFTRENGQLWYANPDTGVYFSIDHTSAPPDDPDDSPVPEGSLDSGLSFNLNYNRPSFFGFEAMPIVVQLTREFHLGTYNPQADEPSAVQYDVEAASLLNSWLAHNRNATLTLLQQGLAPPSHMPQAKSLRVWKYMAAKGRLARFLGEDIFVPKVIPLSHNESLRLDVGFVCTEGVASIVPAVEWVLVVREKKGLFKPKADSEIGVFRYETFLELVGQYLEPFKHEEFELKIIKPESAGAVGKILRSCDLPSNRSDFKTIAPDSFIDSEVAEAVSAE